MKDKKLVYMGRTFCYVKNGKLLSWQGMINAMAVLLLGLCTCVLVHCVKCSVDLSAKI